MEQGMDVQPTIFAMMFQDKTMLDAATTMETQSIPTTTGTSTTVPTTQAARLAGIVTLPMESAITSFKSPVLRIQIVQLAKPVTPQAAFASPETSETAPQTSTAPLTSTVTSPATAFMLTASQMPNAR